MFAIGALIAFVIAFFVGVDANKRYPGVLIPILWFFGVWGLLIAFLPAYLIIRPEKID